MRFENNTHAHIYTRGHRKQEIFLEPGDWWRAVFMLRYFNDEYSPPNVFRQLDEMWKSDFHGSKPLLWPSHWPEHKPVVHISTFTFMNNHYHFSLQQLCDGGITKFMRKFNTGMANYFNTKYKQVGSLFQGKYKGKAVKEDNYFMYLSVYIQVKNTFERYPEGGLVGALENFDKAYDWATQDPFTSLGDYAGERNSPIIEKGVLGEMFPTPKKYKEFARQCMLDMNLDEKLGQLKID